MVGALNLKQADWVHNLPKGEVEILRCTLAISSLLGSISFTDNEMVVYCLVSFPNNYEHLSLFIMIDCINNAHLRFVIKHVILAPDTLERVCKGGGGSRYPEYPIFKRPISQYPNFIGPISQYPKSCVVVSLVMDIRAISQYPKFGYEYPNIPIWEMQYPNIPGNMTNIPIWLTPPYLILKI